MTIRQRQAIRTYHDETVARMCTIVDESGAADLLDSYRA